MVDRKELQKHLTAVYRALHEYNKKEDRWNRALCGGCSIGAYVLNQILREQGINSEIVFSKHEGHVWVEVGGFVLDPTSTQFTERSDMHPLQCPRVGKRKDRDYFDYESAKEQFRHTGIGIRKHLQLLEWFEYPTNQVVRDIRALISYKRKRPTSEDDSRDGLEVRGQYAELY